MCRLLIFGGTSEGRELAEFCADNEIDAYISVTTDYGVELLPESDNIKILTGKLDGGQMKKLISEHEFDVVIDATHPYAELATENIKSACACLDLEYYRLVREGFSPFYGVIAENMDEVIKYLNSSNKRILSTLGSKELSRLRSVTDHKNRVWVRVLDSEEIIFQCRGFGFSGDKIITGKGPFSVRDNIGHIKLSGAEILVTKESGTAGGYPEKIQAAKECGIEVLTLKRPYEKGYNINEIKKIIIEKTER